MKRGEFDEDFKKSSLCPGKHARCVSVKRTKNAVLVKDTKTGVTQIYDHAEWSAFIEGAKKGEFDI